MKTMYDLTAGGAMRIPLIAPTCRPFAGPACASPLLNLACPNQTDAARRDPAMSPRTLRRLFALLCAAACVVPLQPAMASCTPVNPTNGATVTCSGAANPLAPAYASSASNLTVNVVTGGSLGVLLGLGGTAMSLTGNGTTLNNSGTIDPSLLGLLSLLSSGTVIGNPNLGSAIAGSSVTVNNQSVGIMKGTTGLLGLNLGDLTGMALAVRNGAGGTTSLSNAGTVASSALLGVSLLGSDAPVIAAYGGGQISFTNTGNITGRTGFEPSAPGNAFVNAGTISGSVSMGANSTNTFTAVSGSDVNNGGSLGLNLLGVLGINLNFAPTGQVDGGAGGNNTLVLQNVVTGPGSGTGGTVTNASSATYINFQHLIVNSGTWNLQGALVNGDATLNDGLANFDNDANFGSAPIIANGGAIAASTGGSTLSKAITLNAGGLIAQAGNDFTLSGALSGFGALIKNGTGTLTLAGLGSYSGGTVVTAGTFALGGGGALPAYGMVNLGAGSVLDLSGANANQTIGALVGASGSTINLGARTLTLGDGSSTTFAGIISGTGSIAKQGLGTLTLTGSSTYSGGTAVGAGEIFAAGNGALGTGPVIVNGGTLAGAVTLPNSLALSSGFVVPGDGVAVNQTLTVASYAQTAGTLTINANGAGQNSMLGVQGTAMLGGTLHLNFAAAPVPGQVYTVVTALSVSGTFSGITSSSLPSGFALSPIYGPSSVQILIIGPATHFGIAAPGSATAGTAFAFTVTALDSGGNTATTYAGTVHFTSSDGTALLPADATLSNGVGTFNATLKTAGGQTLTATDTVTGSITGSASITVGKAATTTALTAVPATTSYGQSVTLTAAVSLPPGNADTLTGAVDFSDGGVAIPGCSGVAVDASGNATCTTANLATGVRSLRADYLGDGNSAASFGTLQFTVSTATTAMTLTATPNPAIAGQTVTLTATLTNGGSSATPTGSVAFFDGTTSLGSVALDANGVAVLTLSSLAQGTHALSAEYAGGGGFASASAQLSLVMSAPPVLVPTPALSEWMLVLFATLMVAVGVRVVRER